MKKIFKEAHKMTKQMVAKYGVDYQAQFGLNLSYLLENKEEEKVEKMIGSEKQVKWAEDIKKNLIMNANLIKRSTESEVISHQLQIYFRTYKDEIIKRAGTSEMSGKEGAEILDGIMTDVITAIENEQSAKRIIEIGKEFKMDRDFNMVVKSFLK